ncbi:MAG: tRNA-specific adenosine deaminase [Chlamydiae bacterium]|nr:tRNA-specific adenosine deaminase [Chlamydiota bacterium]
MFYTFSPLFCMDQKNSLPDDLEFMREALSEAQKAFDMGEVPVGAVLLLEGQIIARSFNQVEATKDPSAHAELLAIREGARVIGDWRLLETTLYTTLEPCLMCAGALLLSRVKRIVWGAPDLRHGAHGSFLNVFEANHPTHRAQIEGGVLKEEAGELMRKFFKRRRDEKVTRRAL